MNLYISRQGQTLGPYSDEQVRQQVNAGAFSLDDLACPVGGQQWLPIRQVLPPAPNQPAAPQPPPAGYPPANSPPGSHRSATYSPSQPPRRSGRGLIFTALVLVLLLAGAGVYAVLPSEVTGQVSQWDSEGDATFHLPVGATVTLYEDTALEPRIRTTLRAAKAYIRANQGHIDEDKLHSITADLPAPDQFAVTDRLGNFALDKVPKLKPYLVVAWDHATVNGVTRQRAWIKTDQMALSGDRHYSHDMLFQRRIVLIEHDMVSDE